MSDFFILRVELHENDDGDLPSYDGLHTALAQAGFYRTIEDDTRHWHWLPPATYIASFSQNEDRVYARAIKAVREYWTFSGILLIPASHAYFQGLRPATAADRRRESASRAARLARLAAG